MRTYRGHARRFAAAGLLVLTMPATALVAACGSAARPGAVNAARTVTGGRVTDSTVTGTFAGASCAAESPAQLMAAARVVFTGTFLPGPAVRSGGRHLLLSPARVRVTRYLKGSGPRIVWVRTAVTKQGGDIAENAEGILAKPGQEWKIFASSRHSPFLTSVCGGSRMLVGDRAIP